ncbi:MAG: cytochrome d ubiquinol oxidase subunit II [Bacteroidota bacterium]
MEIFWAVIVVAMLTIFVILDGFDFGAGIINLLFSESEEERAKITQAIGPYWDGNEVWLLAGGGVLFFAFPTLYATAFSGFYLPLIMVLWLLIFRGIGLELRNLVDNEMWRAIWDKAFGIASLLLAVFFGAALGNVVRGVNLGGVVDGVSKYEPHNFFVPLWNHNFSPLEQEVGVLDWFTILLGLVAAVTLTIHGAAWIRYKLSGDVNSKMKKIIPIALGVQIILIIVSVAAISTIKPATFKNFMESPVLFIFPVLAIIGLIGIFVMNKMDKEGATFLSSALFIFGAFLTTIMGMFPVLLPSTNSVNPSLTISSMKAADYGLEVGLYWWVIGIVLTVSYFVIVHRLFRGKLDDNTYGH